MSEQQKRDRNPAEEYGRGRLREACVAPVDVRLLRARCVAARLHVADPARVGGGLILADEFADGRDLFRVGHDLVQRVVEDRDSQAGHLVEVAEEASQFIQVE